MASNTYDAIVIGGGHNGLTSGAYFAREGARTVVLESRNKTGGAADTSAPFADHPEINVTTYSYVMSLMPPSIIRELNLKRFGYDVTPFGPYFQAFPDGRVPVVEIDTSDGIGDVAAAIDKGKLHRFELIVNAVRMLGRKALERQVLEDSERQERGEPLPVRR